MIFGLLGIGIVLLIIGVGYVFVMDQRSRIALDPELVSAMRNGGFEEALSYRDKALQDATVSEAEKAKILFATYGADFHVTGDFSAWVRDARNMKQVFLEEDTSLWTRVNALNNLATVYYSSGREQAVFDEVFNSEPFAQYLVPGDPDLSIRQLMEFSYDTYPTSYSAIMIARWYSEQAVNNPRQAASTTEAYAKVAEDYLKRADRATLREEKQENKAEYLASSRYLTFRYYRMLIISRLATQLGAPYSEQFDREYQNFFDFVKSQPGNPVAESYGYYARFFYASKLNSDKRPVAEIKEQLDILAESLSLIEDPKLITFINYLKNQRQDNPKSPPSRLVSVFSEISPEFKTQMQRAGVL